MIMQDENGIRYYLKISKIARLSNVYLAQDIPAIFQDQRRYCHSSLWRLIRCKDKVRIVRLNCLQYKNKYEHSGITFMNILVYVLMPMSLSNVYQNDKKILLWHKNVNGEINDSW